MFNETSSDSESKSSTFSPKVVSPKGVIPFAIPESNFESVKEPNPPLPGVPASSMAAFDVFISEFNKMNSFSYSSTPPNDCFISETNIENDIEIIKAMEEHEKRTSIIEETEKVDTSDTNTPREVQIGLTLDSEEKTELVVVLKEFNDVFAWSYEDMPGIDPEIAEHNIPLILESKPVKKSSEE